MVFLLGFAKKEILFPLSFAAFFRRKLGKEPYAPALQQKMLSLRSGRKKPGTFRRKGGAACRWHVSSAVLRCRVGRSYRSPPGTKTRSGAETASRSRGSSRRSPNRVRRSFASGLEKGRPLPSPRGEGGPLAVDEVEGSPLTPQRQNTSGRWSNFVRASFCHLISRLRRQLPLEGKP